MYTLPFRAAVHVRQCTIHHEAVYNTHGHGELYESGSATVISRALALSDSNAEATGEGPAGRRGWLTCSRSRAAGVDTDIDADAIATS